MIGVGRIGCIAVIIMQLGYAAGPSIQLVLVALTGLVSDSHNIGRHIHSWILDSSMSAEGCLRTLP